MIKNYSISVTRKDGSTLQRELETFHPIKTLLEKLIVDSIIEEDGIFENALEIRISEMEPK